MNIKDNFNSDHEESECAEDVYVVHRIDERKFNEELHKLVTTDLVSCISEMDELGEEFALSGVSISIEASKEKYGKFKELDRIAICDGLFVRVICEVKDGSVSYAIVFNCDRLVFPEDCSELFMGVRAGSMSFSMCDFSAVGNAECMFYESCFNSLHLENLNTLNLWCADYMFKCACIDNLYFEGMRMDKLRTAVGMFYLFETSDIDLSQFVNMNNLKNIHSMFYGTKAKSINTGNLGGAVLLVASGPFDNCSASITGGLLVKLKVALAYSNY